MGRKIPAKKHRGVKDPLVQQARRWQSLKGKINAPPLDPDSQPVPKSLQRLFAPRGPRAHPPRPPRPPRPAPAPALPPRVPRESARCYSRRLTLATHALLAADHSQQYPLEEEDEHFESTRRRAHTHSDGGTHTRATKRDRRKLAVKAKKEQLREQQRQELSSQPVYERVPFGERAAAPPALGAPRGRLARGSKAHTPGGRQLLLSSLLRRDPAADVDVDADADVLRRERARLHAVEAYREMKRRKQHKHNTH